MEAFGDTPGILLVNVRSYINACHLNFRLLLRSLAVFVASVLIVAPLALSPVPSWLLMSCLVHQHYLHWILALGCVKVRLREGEREGEMRRCTIGRAT